jgi:hypothetical protein
MSISAAGTVTINNLAGTGNRDVYADANGVLNVGANVMDNRSVNSNTVSGLVANKSYLVCIYGYISNRGTGATSMGEARITSGNTFGSTSLFSTNTATINWPDGSAPASACFVITSPAGGQIWGWLDGGSGTVMTMTVVQLTP